MCHERILPDPAGGGGGRRPARRRRRPTAATAVARRRRSWRHRCGSGGACAPARAASGRAVRPGPRRLPAAAGGAAPQAGLCPRRRRRSRRCAWPAVAAAVVAAGRGPPARRRRLEPAGALPVSEAREARLRSWSSAAAGRWSRTARAWRGGRCWRGACPGWAAGGGRTARVLVSAGIHGPEYVGAAVVLALLERAEREPELRRLRERAELWVIPCLNPDGYARVWARQGVGRLRRAAPQRPRGGPEPQLPAARGAPAAGAAGRGVDPAGGGHLRGRGARCPSRRPPPWPGCWASTGSWPRPTATASWAR